MCFAKTMTRFFHLLSALSIGLLNGCATVHSFDPAKETVLPLSRASVLQLQDCIMKSMHNRMGG